MVIRIAAIWLLLLVMAFASASLREGLLRPRLGEQWAHVLGTLIVVVVFAVTIWMSVRWVTPSLRRADLVIVGVAWLIATVLFEFGFGHYVMGHTWTRLLADYNVLAGRVWILVLLTLLAAPIVAGELQRPNDSSSPAA